MVLTGGGPGRLRYASPAPGAAVGRSPLLAVPFRPAAPCPAGDGRLRVWAARNGYPRGISGRLRAVVRGGGPEGWREPAMEWWIWLVIVATVLLVLAVAALAVQARRRAGGVIARGGSRSTHDEGGPR
ncbi:hypothetical protein BJP39_24960 [Streptomyces sp. CC77]|nr:hypothetical protein BJP39_24960 [Streptomyces sp. CC77]